MMGVRIEKRTLDALVEMHDGAPNAEKRGWAAAVDAAEQAIGKQDAGEEPDLEALAGILLDAARRRLDAMVDAVRSGSGMDRDDAVRAVEASRAGSTLTELVELAEQMRGRAADVGKAADELDRLAKERAGRTGETFLGAYERVCEDEPDLAKRAVHGTIIDPRDADITMEEFLFDKSVRSSGATRAVEASLRARRADEALLKRAKQIQVERASERLHLTAAIAIAKAEDTALAKHATL